MYTDTVDFVLFSISPDSTTKHCKDHKDLKATS